MQYSLQRKDEALKIMYLFLHMDDTCPQCKSDKYNLICKSIGASKEERKEIETWYRMYTNDIMSALDELLNRVKENYGLFMPFLKKDSAQKKDQAFIMWSLIELAYADKSMSGKEKDTLTYIAEKWEMEEIVVADMLDTAETIQGLYKHKEWVKKTKHPYDEITAKISDIDSNIKHMYDNIELLIQEAEVIEIKEEEEE